jgi:argininosuccinate lyase
VTLAGLGRFVQDMLLWCTMEFGYLRLADGFVQSSSIMPQKRNPVALEHARAIGSKAVGQAAAITLAVHNTPFGDIVDTEDDLQPLVASMFRDAVRAVTLVAAAMKDASFDVAKLETRAAEGGTTLSELADHLVRKHGLSFKTAHGIAARLMRTRRENADTPLAATLATVSADLLGAPLQYTDSEITEVMSARHFVEVRGTHGGPAPRETARAIAESRQALDRDAAWIAGIEASLAAAELRLQQRVKAL